MTWWNSLKPSERRLAMITLALVAGFIVYQFAFTDSEVVDAVEPVVAIEELEAEYEENVAALSDASSTLTRYERIADRLPQGENMNRPDLAFMDEVARLCSQMGFQFPPIDPNIEEIKGVTDYELVSVTVRTEGTFDATSRLLQAFEGNGLIFREVELRGTRDADRISTRITVARIAPAPKNTNRARRRF